MVGSGLTKPRQALTPLGSQSSDEAVINEQLKNDIESQFDSKNTAASRKLTKRKSRGADDLGDSDTDGSPRKKRSEKNKKKRERKRLSELQNRQFTSPESSASGEGRSKELTNETPRTAAKPAKVPSLHLDGLDITETGVYGEQNEGGKSEHYSSNLSGTGRRASLGPNREALLQSILKGCGLEKSAISKTEHIISRSETGESPVAPATTGTPETSSKEKSRRKVSMVPILPEGYKPSRSGRFHCPVEGCDKIYSRRSTLGEHMNALHAGEILKDNLDGTMTIVSTADYQKAISSGNTQMIVEIPSVPLPRKTRNADRPKVDNNKAIKDRSSSVSLLQGSRDGDVAHKMGSSGAKGSNTQGISDDAKNTPIAARTMRSTSTHSERSSSETSGENESDIEESSRPRKSAARLSMTRKPQPGSSTDSPLRVSSIVKQVAPAGSEAILSSDSKMTHREGSMDVMEDWEIKPGVIIGSASKRRRNSETEHNIAYSSSYLNSANAGVKLSGFHFQVIRIAPGSTSLGQNVPYLRVCSVAAGKVLVEVGEKSFSIGANGMWRIKAGEHCTILNRHYGEAVIHVSTINSK